jgi:hypothetical protein
VIIVHLKKDGIKMEKGMALASEDVSERKTSEEEIHVSI